MGRIQDGCGCVITDLRCPSLKQNYMQLFPKIFNDKLQELHNAVPEVDHFQSE